MKKSKTLNLCISCIFVLLLFSNSVAFCEELKLNSDDTKPCINYPVDPHTKAIADEKQKLAQQYRKEKYTQSQVKNSMLFAQKFDKEHKSKLIPTPNIKPTGLSRNNIFLNSADASACYLPVRQQSQINSYYCGPATASEILTYKDVNISQSTSADMLGTTSNGTDWYNGTYPMQKTLNYYLNTSYYVPYGTSVDADTFTNDIVYDLDRSYPVAADAWEVAGGPHLVGHPSDRTIYHWIAIDSYLNYGSTTRYDDSVSGATSISWSSSVPIWSDLPSSTLARIVNGRGIIW